MEKPKRRRGRPPVHGYTGTKEYTAWLRMRAVCNNPDHVKFKYVGGRGIGYASEFDTFESFLKCMGPRPDGTKFMRKDVTKDFSVANCEWR